VTQSPQQEHSTQNNERNITMNRVQYKIQLSSKLKGLAFANGVEFDSEGLSLDCVSADRIQVFAGQSNDNYSLVPYRDAEDVQTITRLALELNENTKKLSELQAQVIELESKLDAAQQAGK
jgi:hypothetical protein